MHTDNDIRGAWIVFPITLKMVFIQNSVDIEHPAAELREIRSLFSLLYILKNRFSGGLYICNIIDTVISSIVLDGSKSARHEVIGLLQDAAGIIARSLAYGVVPTAKL